MLGVCISHTLKFSKVKFLWHPMAGETIAILDLPPPALVCLNIKSEAKATGHLQITAKGLRTNLLLLGAKVENFICILMP